jgi:hypothetical protein
MSNRMISSETAYWGGAERFPGQCIFSFNRLAVRQNFTKNKKIHPVRGKWRYYANFAIFAPCIAFRSPKWYNGGLSRLGEVAPALRRYFLC